MGRSAASSCPERIAHQGREATLAPRVSSSNHGIRIEQPSQKASENGELACASNFDASTEDSLTVVPKVPERFLSPILTPTTVANSFLDIEDDHAGNAERLQMMEKASGDINSHSNQSATKELGFSFNDLVDRLLSPPMSKSDAKFTAIFLCLYRKFAAPSDLLSAITRRFEQLNQRVDLQLQRISSQLRCLNILAQWISDYPGDFAHVSTRGDMASFISGLVGSRVFAVASKEMGFHLDAVAEDDDTEWGCSDSCKSSSNSVENCMNRSAILSGTSTNDANISAEEAPNGSVLEQEIKRCSARSSATPSTSSSVDRSASQSTGSFQTLLNSVENAQRQAQLLTPIPRTALTKIQWHELMNTSDDEIAREMTRIDWIMFSSIRPRDLVRHVILPANQKEKCKGLENVNRMINQFNHIAFWVANMILLRNKAKHRAKALEKFMGVAWVSQM